MKDLSKRTKVFPITILCLLMIAYMPSKAQPICSMTVGIQQDSVSNCGMQEGYSVTQSNGVGPFSYQWSNGAITNKACQQLSAGQSLCVTVTDAIGCQATSCYTFNCGMYANVQQDLNLSCGSQAGFTANPNNGLPPFSYLWDNGSTGFSTCANLAQNQSLCVTITDARGCQATSCYTAYCNLTGYINLVNDSTNACPGMDAYGIYGLMGGVAPYSFQWSNGSTSSRSCANLPVNQSLCVTITDANGCQATSCYTAFCSLSGSIVQDSSVSCTGKTGFKAYAIGGNTPFSYAWDNGSTLETTCQNLPVNQTLCVTITDAKGCQATSCYTASCQIWGNVDLRIDSITQCTGQQLYAISNIQGGIAPYTLHWDNGATGNYTCANLGTGQTICVQITDANGCQATSCYQTPPPCQAYFYHSLSSANTVDFHNYSSYNPISAFWDFGDGTTSTDMNPSHTFTATGTYNVCLTTNDLSGCSSQTCNSVTIQAPFIDVAAFCYSSNVVPGFVYSATPFVYNYANSTTSGSISYRYPAGTTFVSSDWAVASHDVANRILVFNYFGLYPSSAQGPTVQLMAAQSLILGTAVSDSAWVTPLSGDINPSDNHTSSSYTVVGSFDPNDKAVSPSGEGDEGIVAHNTSALSYRIRFQNTGTAPARTVIVRDIIDNNIDINSIVVSEASHSHRFKIVGNEMEITFDNINLADSFSNEPASHGYFMYTAKVKSGLPIETKIYNTARIYFDFNAPVVTNTVVTTLGKVSGIKEAKEQLLFNLVPNPTNSGFVVKGEWNETIKVSLIDALGVVIKQTTVAPNALINVEDIATGIYIVKVETASKTGVQRLVVAH
jgi:uncharacterized repeat protein (TIGR01451 family)